ncbi:MAG TPA: pyrroline-5-carboxylate reductase [Longimicrobiales bacterium]|nr:pyrroline-5-carboxylate reductase [Longimicrobiales bacterium]
MTRLAVLGGGNLGRALALGWVGAGRFAPSDIHVTRRQADKLHDLRSMGYYTTADNAEAVRECDVVVMAVQPQQLDELLGDISDDLDEKRHRVISVVSGVSIAQARAALGSSIPVVRAMPNTAVAIGESMTCLSADERSGAALAEATELFDLVGRTLVIQEEMMAPATALCACGVAFFLRCIRAASQGGIEIGFHPEEALLLAGQTARGAAALSLRENSHPEGEIDRVTTPRGCTIVGLNEMEHRGLSSALIKGLIVSARAAEQLYTD